MNRYFNPVNYIAKFKLYKPFYNSDVVNAREDMVFKSAKLDQEAGLKKLNAVLAQIGRGPFVYDVDTIHWLLFACLSLNNPKKILEIGTYDGRFTKILGLLNPDAVITSVDLPENDPILRTTYNRDSEDHYQSFKETQEKNLKGHNVRMLEVNSFFLPAHVEVGFDQIWVDGGHLNPTVAWDLCNAYHLCRRGGIIGCDDVRHSGKANQYTSDASSQVLSYIQERTGEQVNYFLKRRRWDYELLASRRKLVAIMQRN